MKSPPQSPDKATLEIQNILRLGSPATTWKRLGVASIAEAQALVDSLRAKGLLAASSDHTVVWAFAHKDSAHLLDQFEFGAGIEQASGSLPPQPPEDNNSLHELLRNLQHAVDDHLSSVLLSQFEQHERGFFMLPLGSSATKAAGNREAFQLEFFIQDGSICLQVNIWQHTSAAGHASRLHAAELLGSNASFELHKIICLDAPRSSSPAVETATDAASAPVNGTKLPPSVPEEANLSVADTLGEVSMFNEDLLSDGLGSFSGMGVMQPPQQSMDDLYEWLNNPTSEHAEHLRCWNYLHSKERALIEKSAEEKQQKDLKAVAARYASTRARMQVCAQPNVVRMGARAFDIQPCTAQQNAMRQWFDQPQIEYRASDRSLGEAVGSSRSMSVHVPGDEVTHQPQKRPKLGSLNVVSTRSTAVAQLIVDQSLDRRLAQPECRLTTSVRASVLCAVRAIIERSLGPVSCLLPEAVVPTDATPMIANFGDGSVVVSPSVFASWERTRVQPCGGPLVACYYLLCPAAEFVQAEASDFLDEISGTFEAMCLGSHTVADSGGIQLINGCEQQPSNGSELRCSESEWCDAVRRLIVQLQQQGPAANVVVYMLGTQADELLWLDRIGQLYEECSKAGVPEPAVQWLKVEHVVSLVHPIDLMKDLAISVYLKLCRLRSTPAAALVDPEQGVWCVERRQSAGLVCMMTVGPRARRTVHCCYRYTPGGLEGPGCVAAVWVDCCGSQLMSFLGFGASCQLIIAKCWELGKEFLVDADGAWCVVVSCLGQAEDVQVDAWREAVSNREQAHRLVFLSVDVGVGAVADMSADNRGSCAAILQHAVGSGREHQTKFFAFVGHSNNSGSHLGYKVMLVGSWGESGELSLPNIEDLRQVVIQFNALSWLTASPLQLDRPGPLPIHLAAVEKMVRRVDALRR